MHPQVLRGIFGFALAVLIFLMGRGVKNYLAGQKEEASTRASQPTVRYVKTETVDYSAQQVFIRGNGRVVSGNTIDIIAEVQGTIIQGSIPLKTGSRFSKGQLILKIDDREAILNVQASRSQFMTSLANILPDIRIDYKEHYTKWQAYYERIDVESNLPELPKINDTKEKTFIASRNILNQYYSIKSAEERLSKYRVYAPYSGSISQVMLEAGSVVNPGVMIARIIPNGDLEIEIPVKSDDIGWIRNGAKVSISSADGLTQWNGYIHRINNYVDPATQSLNVYAKITTGQQAIFEGMYMDVTIPGTVLEDVMKVPRDALFENNKVYVVQDSVLQKVMVDVKNMSSDDVYFTGVPSGRAVVVEPLVNAYEGLRVKIMGATSP